MHLRRQSHALGYAVVILLSLLAMNAHPAFAVTFEDVGVWTEQSPPSPLPGKRMDHALAELSGTHVLLFGGLRAVSEDVSDGGGGWEGYEIAPSETWVYDADLTTWTQMSPVQSPSARTGHAMAYLGGDKVVLFGGYTILEEITNETWVYDLSENSWTLMQPDVSPPARGYHEMARIQDDQVLLFGGDTDGFGAYLDDTWIYDLSENSWTQLFPSETPAARGHHAMAYLASGWALLYGRDFTAPGDPDPHETWVFCLDETLWFNAEEDSFPSARAMPALAGLGFFSSVLYGGAAGTQEDDTWFFSAASGWVEHDPMPSPGSRAGHDLVTLSGDRVLLFGGMSEEPYVPRNDTWIYQSNPVPRIIVQPTSGLITDESGATATFIVAAATPPATDVTLPLTSSDPSEGTVPAFVTILAGSTDPVTVTVTGVGDALADGDIAYTIVTGDPSGGGVMYDEMGPGDVPDISVTNLDTHPSGLEVLGKETWIPSGDTTPSSADGTRFASTPRGTRVSQSFTIRNTSDAALELTGSPLVSLGGSSDFSVTSQPASTTLLPGASAEFTIQCRPSGDGASTATVAITSTDESSPYTFTIRCNGTTEPEITVFGNGRIIPNGDVTPSGEEQTEFTSVGGLPVTQTFEIENSGTEELLLSGGPHYVTVDHPGFTVSRQPEREIGVGRSKTFDITFHPSEAGTVEGTVRIGNSDPDEDPYEFLIRGISPDIHGPWPDAGPDQIVGVGERVILDASGSRVSSAALAGPQDDPQSAVSYRWAFSTRTQDNGSAIFLVPTGSRCMQTCQGFEQPLASFLADVEGDYTLTLTVTDSQGRSATDEVTISARWNPGSADFRIDEIVIAPNPFSGSATVRFEGSGTPDRVELSIFDLAGNQIWEGAGTSTSSLSWNGRTSDGEAAPNGAYIAVAVFAGNGQIYTDRVILFLYR